MELQRPTDAPDHRYVTAGELDSMITRMSASFTAAIDRLGTKLDAQDAKFESRLEQSRTKPGTLIAAISVVAMITASGITGGWALLTRTVESRALVNEKNIEKVDGQTRANRDVADDFRDRINLLEVESARSSEKAVHLEREVDRLQRELDRTRKD